MVQINEDTNFAIRWDVPYQIARMEDKTFLEYKMLSAQRELSDRVFKDMKIVGSPVVLDSHIEEWQDFEGFHYKLHYRVTRVQSHKVIIPEFVYQTVSGQVEWKCPACSTINPIEATYCGEKHKHVKGCGHNRENIR